MDIVFHYPPELLSLLVDTVPLLCRSKRDVILFFKGAGVESKLTEDLAKKLQEGQNNISKYEIARTVLTRLNEKGESTLRERREVLKRVTEFEDYSTCWPENQLKAKGLVSEIRRVIDVKDSFTRMRQEKDEERRKYQDEQQKQMEEKRKRNENLVAIKKELFNLFSEKDENKRGRLLEKVLNQLFNQSGILVREALTLRGAEKEGVVEQIDGVIEIDADLYLVEVRWWKEPLGTGDVSQHLVRVYHRGQARGILISASGFTQPAIAICREALQKSVFVLCKLEEIVFLLEQEKDLKSFFREKINAAIVEKKPLFEPASGARYELH